ncbi:MAG TPA: efflux RND transporter periplasmic adaptor subunit [Candidatus Acidoferrum sp.]|nr:efflux RND transporter periplasmic adaptor subunit [Candidatus Acidoferrum sp.]
MGPTSREADGRLASAALVQGNPQATLQRRRGALGLVLPLAAAMLSVSCNRSQVQAQGPATLPPPLVTVVQATSQDVPRYLDEIGRNVAFESVNVTPQVGGKVTERHFQDGENLKKGQLIFVIDPRPYKAQLDSAKANLAQAEAALELAKVQFARDQELVGTRAISKQDYDTKKSTVDVNEAQVEAAKAAIETAEINLDYCYIHSPIDGRAGARLVDVGNVVQANTTSLLSIQRVDPIYATFTVTEQDLAEVQKKMNRGMLKALVRLPADAENAARPGNVEFLDNAVQNSTGTVNLRATIPNADRHFWPGQFVNVRLVLDMEKGTVLVPSQATQISQKGPFVYVVKSDDTAELRPITLGQRQGSDVVITSGLAAGERVVLAGQLLVQPGGKVHVGSGAPVTAPAANGDDKQKSAGRSVS